LSLSISFKSIAQVSPETVKDIDDNVYPTITIGKQVWMVVNLKTTKYNDGTAIPLVTDDESWKALNTPAYCWFDNDIEYKDLYGALYNWFTINTNKLCPTGWHVPTDTEWTTLTTYLGGFSIAGGKLKETDTIHWQSPNMGATNESGFTALSSGWRDVNGMFSYRGFKVLLSDNSGKFSYKGTNSYWWSASEDSVNSASYHSLIYNSGSIYRGKGGKKDGFSIRCLKD